MVESILYKDKEHFLDRREQFSPSGHSFRYVGLEQDLTKPQIWKDGMYKSVWIYTFLYNDISGGFTITTDQSGGKKIDKINN